jgi:hypothetical protein
MRRASETRTEWLTETTASSNDCADERHVTIPDVKRLLPISLPYQIGLGARSHFHPLDNVNRNGMTRLHWFDIEFN